MSQDSPRKRESQRDEELFLSMEQLSLYLRTLIWVYTVSGTPRALEATSGES